MTKVTRQPSGVTAGTMDDSKQTQPHVASASAGQAAGAALASRRHAGARAAKLDAMKAPAKKAAPVAKRAPAPKRAVAPKKAAPAAKRVVAVKKARAR